MPDLDEQMFWFENSSKLSIFIPTADRIKFNYPSPTRSISCSSSIGDFLFDPLLQPHPVTTRIFIKDSPPFLVIVASDGFWDMFPRENDYQILIETLRSIISEILSVEVNSSDFYDRLQNHLSNTHLVKGMIEKIGLALMKQTWIKWGGPTVMRDDITVVLAFPPYL